MSDRPDEGGAIVPAETAEVRGVGAVGRLMEWSRNVTFVLARSALLTGLCRLVPVPFLDDYLERQSRRFMVASLVHREGRTYSSALLSLLYSEDSDFLSGCFWWVIKLPWTLTVKLLKKLFKKIFFFLAIREAGLSMGETLLLGHCLHRALLRGEFREGSDAPALREESREFKRAFDEAFAGSDRRLLAQLMATVFTQVRSLPKAGAHAVRAMFGRGKTRGDEPGAVPPSDEPALAQGVEELHQAMTRTEVTQFLADFEVRFDAARAQHRGP